MYDEVCAEYSAAREILEAACNDAITELVLGDIEEEREKTMIQQLDLCVEHLICALCDLEAHHFGLVRLHLPDQLESSFWVLNEMIEVKDAIRGYSSPSILAMFKIRHKWPDIMGKSLKFPRFPSKLPSPSPRVSPGTLSTIPSSCSPRTCPSMPPTSPQSTSRGAARPGTLSVSSVRPGWRASSPPGTGMGSMPTPTYPRGSFRSSAVPGCKSVARMSPGMGRISSPGMGIRRGSGPSP